MTAVTALSLVLGGTAATAGPLAPSGVGTVALPALTPDEAAAPAAPAIPGVLINEVEAASWVGAKDGDGEAKDWVELYNPTTTAVDLSNWGLSNKPDSPFRWVFPQGQTIEPGRYLVVWLSKKNRAVAGKELHASFNLDNGSDPLFLTTPNGTPTGQVVDQAAPVFMKQDMSWCRIPNGAATSPFQVCAKQTKGAANSGEAFATIAATPTIAPMGGLYPSAQTVTLSAAPGAQIRYTLDGSTPTASSTLYANPIAVTKSQSVRAVAFETGKMPSLQATESYVVDAQAATKYGDQRVVMVTLTPAELAAYKAKNKSTVMASTVDMREKDGSVIWRGEAESDVAGQLGSRQSQGQAQLNITLREARGAKSFKYNLFPGKGDKQEISRFRLRNSSSDWWYARLRDAFAQSASGGEHSLWSDWSPTVLFVNGQYDGVMDIREREDESLVESATGLPDDGVQYVSDGVEKNGGAAAEKAYSDLISWFRSTDLTKPANYAAAQEKVDIENVAAVTAAYGWANVWDWPWKNINAWRSLATDDKWRYQVHDFDIALDAHPTHNYGANTRAEHDMYSSIYASNNYVFSNLMKNPEFRKLYINTVADQLNHQYRADIATAKLDAMVAELKPYMREFRAKYPALGTVDKWESVDIARLRAYVNARPGYLDTQTQKKYNLTARKPLTVGVNDAGAGWVRVNTLSLDGLMAGATPTWTGSYYPEVPVTLTAQAKPGFRFVGWQGANTSTDATIALPVKAATSVTAVFEAAGTPAKPVFAGAGNLQSLTGDYADVTIGATDPGGFPLTYDGKKLPKGIDIDPASGRITGTITTPGEYKVRVIASNGVTSNEVAFTWTVTDRPGTGADSPALTGAVQTEYWKNETLAGPPAAVQQSSLSANFGSAKPLDGFSTSDFSMRWTTSVTSAVTGTHVLRMNVGPNDGVRVYVDGELALDKWTNTSRAQTFDVPLELTEGRHSTLVIEFVDYSGDAMMVPTWQVPGAADFAPIPASALTAGSVPIAPADPDAPVPPPAVAPRIAPIVSEYWKNTTLTGAAALVKDDEQAISVKVAGGTAPFTGFPTAFSARWTTTLVPSTTGRYGLRIADGASDAVRVWVGDRLVHEEWPAQSAAATKDVYVDLVEDVPVGLKVEFADPSGAADLGLTMMLPDTAVFSPLPAPDPALASPRPSLGAITTEYWNNRTLTGTPVATNDAPIGLDLASGTGPVPGLSSSGWTVRWSTQLTAAQDGEHVLRVANRSDDGVRVYVGDALVLDNWSGRATTSDVPVQLKAGEPVALRVEYLDITSASKLDVTLKAPGSPAFSALSAAG